MLDFAFKVLVNQFGVTVRAFDPALLARDLQPDAWVAKGPLAAITGDPVVGDDAGLGYRRCHVQSRVVVGGLSRHMSR